MDSTCCNKTPVEMLQLLLPLVELELEQLLMLLPLLVLLL